MLGGARGFNEDAPTAIGDRAASRNESGRFIFFSFSSLNVTAPLSSSISHRMAIRGDIGALIPSSRGEAKVVHLAGTGGSFLGDDGE